LQLPNFTNFGSSRFLFSTSPKKALRFLLSVEYFPRAFYWAPGSDLLGLLVTLKTQTKETVKDFLPDFLPDKSEKTKNRAGSSSLDLTIQSHEHSI
jgi:hypothetical protein